MTHPPPKMPKLIVVMAFDRNDNGELVTAFGPQDYASEDRAVQQAQTLAPLHAGVIAWSREANPDLGEYGEPAMLFQAGEVPDMD